MPTGRSAPMEVSLTGLQLNVLVVNNKKYYFCELSQRFNLEAALQTNGVPESDVKEVTKKLLENVPIRIDGAKYPNDANERINTTNVD